MSALTMPADGVRDISWQLEQPAQVNRSELTGATKVLLSGAARWRAKVDVAVRTPAEMLAWKAFLTNIRGAGNTFEVPAVKPGEQASVAVATVTAVAGAAGSTLATTGWGLSPSTLAMSAGMTISHANRLHILGANLVTKSGDGTLADMTVRPALAAAAVNGAVIQVRNPVGIMRLIGGTVGWLDALSNYFPFSFECEEAF